MIAKFFYLINVNVSGKKLISQEASSFKLQKFLEIVSYHKNSDLYTSTSPKNPEFDHKTECERDN